MTSSPFESLPSPDGGIEVLYVGRERANATISHLEGESDRITVRQASSANAGREALLSEAVDSIVTEYDLPGETGTEFLESVSETRPDGPIVLVVDREEEPTASEVVSAGVTEYVRMEMDSAAYSDLADRIENAVDRTRDRQRTAATRELFRTLVDDCSDVLAVLDPDGTVIYVSHTTDPVLGRDHEEYVGKSLFDDVVHPSDRDHVVEQFGQLRADPGTDTIALEFRAPAGDSSWEWIAATVSDRRDTPADGFVLIARSVVRTPNGRRLERQHDLFEAARDIADIGVWRYDVGSDTLRWTEQARHLPRLSFGEELSLAESFERYHPDDRPRMREAFDRAVNEGEPFDEVARIVTEGDDDGWMRARGEPELSDGAVVRVRGIFMDITDLKRREEQFRSLHEASQELMRATTRADVAEITIDAAKNILGYIMAAVRFVDEDREVLRTFATTDMNVVAAGERPDYRVDEEVPAARTFRRGEPEIWNDLNSTDDEYDRGRLRSGMYVPIGEHGVFSCGETEPDAYDDTDVDLIAVLANITATALTRMESRQELRRKNERLNEFASIVAHDLQNPLQVALGHVQYATESGSEESLEEAKISLSRMQSLIDDLLLLARQGTNIGERTRVDLYSIAESSWETVATDAATLSASVSLGAVQGDDVRLRELFENLFRNAIDHGGESVTVRIGPLEDGFFVEDDGDGIPDDRKTEVFEAGYTTAGAGTGYGLYIVREIVFAHGWDVTLTDGREGGARFEITDVDLV